MTRLGSEFLKALDSYERPVIGVYDTETVSATIWYRIDSSCHHHPLLAEGT